MERLLWGSGLLVGSVMRWVILLLVLSSIELAWADEDNVPMLDEKAQAAVAAYEQAIRRFNTHTKPFTSWAAFKAEVFSRLPSGLAGTCYEQMRGSMRGIKRTMVKFQPVVDEGWQKTRGSGWRKNGPDRTFVEYRFNQKAKVLLRAEGVNPRFFFAWTRRICEFPLAKQN